MFLVTPLPSALMLWRSFSLAVYFHTCELGGVGVLLHRMARDPRLVRVTGPGLPRHPWAGPAAQPCPTTSRVPLLPLPAVLLYSVTKLRIPH